MSETKIPDLTRVFSLNFWWGGTQNFRSPLGTKSDGGGYLQKKSDWSQNCPPNANLGHFLLNKHEIQLFKVLLSLKVVKFDTKMYLNFSNFQGWTSAGGGQALVQKWEQVSDGGIDKIFARWGDPLVLPGKKPCLTLVSKHLWQCYQAWVKIHGGDGWFALKISQIALNNRWTGAKKMHDKLMNRPSNLLGESL